MRKNLSQVSMDLGWEHDIHPILRTVADEQGALPMQAAVVLSNTMGASTRSQFCKEALGPAAENVDAAPADLDLRPLFGLARLNNQTREESMALDQLRAIMKRHPEFYPADALLGRILIETGDDAGLNQWLPTAEDSQRIAGLQRQEDYWIGMGKWFARESRWDDAVYCFYQVAKTNPNHAVAVSRLTDCLRQSGRDDLAETVAQRTAMLVRLRDLMRSMIRQRSPSQRSATAIIRRLVDLGREREAQLWLKIAANFRDDPDPQFADFQSALAVQSNLPWQRTSKNQIVSVDAQLAKIPMPEMSTLVDSLGSADDRTQAYLETKIRFRNLATQRGLNFATNMGDDPETQGVMIYQSMGTGVAATDFDRDGWQDLYFPDATGSAQKRNSSGGLLARNLDGVFAPVTAAANASDAGYAQGVTSADFNEDGFPDLFICNIGRNTLLQNNGDGTFTDVTYASNLDSMKWSSSAAIADIDGDGIADLVELNYCAGDEPFTRPCISPDLGEPRLCAPQIFPGDSDIFWKGNGDGTFQKTRQMYRADAGRGLGLSVGRFGNEIQRSDRASTPLSMLIANDTTANNLWTIGRDGSLSDAGSIRGVAYDYQTMSQGSMGIATGDFDIDGDIDFLVTNFRNEHNCMLTQTRPGLWIDTAPAAGLEEPSMAIVAFGTELADFDGDGVNDLVILNGNVEDDSHKGVPFKMPPQMFVYDTQRSAWDETKRESIGDYFEQSHIGRSLITGDFDNDGRIDIVTTHLYEPAALLVNESQNPASRHPLGIDVVARSTQRDAIGARITIRDEQGGGDPAGKAFSRFAVVTTGDGYYCRNQSTTFVPLPASGTASVENLRIEILWPSGTTQSFAVPATTRRILVAEGAEPIAAQ
ncbi:MAG: FG-GAP-like repeat-containing protein [Planctomycetota bacterium]